MLALYGIGNIVGAGVYVLIGKIAEPAGYLSIVAFAIAALVAFCSALSYAELAARFPVSAGVAVYLHEAFRAKRLSTIIGLALVVAGIVSSATLIKGFAGYFHALIPLHPTLIMIGITLLLVGVCLRGIKESVGAAAIFTIIEILGLIFLVGSIFISQPEGFGSFGHNFEHALQTIDTTALIGVLSATFIAFYAFVGFEDMVNIAEEVKEPQKAFPKAIITSMLFVTVLYTLVAIATLSVLTPQVLGDSNAPLAKAYEVATNNDAGVIILISLVATLNGILANIIMGSRFLYPHGSAMYQSGTCPTGAC
jgi:APA family basic amino acid/polyamine antiporter